MIITIDGPSGTGKTSVARKVAEKLGMTYFDTGAMYRAFTWVLLNKQIPLSDAQAIEVELENFSFDIRKQNGDCRYFVDEENVTEEIRNQKINDVVSEVAAMKTVRKALWKLQRSYVKKQSAVFEGRDMGSVVFPKAEVKIFLDAKSSVRAKRRLEEMRAKHPQGAAGFDAKSMEKELNRRDAFDSTRKIAPLKCPKGAHRIDTSEVSMEEVVEEIVEYQRKQAKKLIPSWLHSKNMRFIYRFVIFCSWCVFKIFYRHKVYGMEHFVRRAAIIAPNHTSYFDPPLVASSWPEEIHFLAREGLFKPFLFGSFIRALNSHPVHGGAADASVFKTLIRLLKEGKQIVVFPEGERTGGEIGEIKPGIGILVMRSHSAIIPTYIDGAHESWDRDRTLPKLFGKTACVFGTPIVWESYSHLAKREAQDRIANDLSKAIHALKDWYKSGAKGTPP